MSDSLNRHLNLTGASNFRDLGGYPARDGRPVRWRRIFRCSHLGQLTEDDIDALRTLGLKSAFDLRGTEERLHALCRLNGIAGHPAPTEPALLATLSSNVATGKSRSAS